MSWTHDISQGKLNMQMKAMAELRPFHVFNLRSSVEITYIYIFIEV